MPGTCRSMQRSCQAPAPVIKPSAHGWRLARAPLPQASTTRQGCTAGRATAALLAAASTQPQACAVLTSSGAIRAPAGVFGGASDVTRQQRCPSAPTLQRGVGVAPGNPRLARTPAAVPELLASLASSPNRDYYLVAVAAIGAAVWVKVFDLLAANGTLEQKLSRKLVHTTTGPLFVMTWALFSANPSARFLAAVVPMLNFARLVGVGSGLLSDPGLVKSVSRSGGRSELLKGPLFYVITLVAATVLCWRDNPSGLIAVSMMCGGDGLADIVGRRWGGSAKLPYNNAKSWAGSIAMLVGGYAMSYGLISLFCGLGFFTCYPQTALLSCLGAVALTATVVESLPINQYVDDNVSVPVVAACLSTLLLPQPAEAMAAVVAAAVVPVAGLAMTATAAAATASSHVGLAM